LTIGSGTVDYRLTSAGGPNLNMENIDHRLENLQLLARRRLRASWYSVPPRYMCLSIAQGSQFMILETSMISANISVLGRLRETTDGW